MRLRSLSLVPLVLSLLLLAPRTASADFTAFLGANPTPTARTVKGLSGGVGLLIVGFEFEYAHTNEDREQSAPGLWTYMFNGLVQTPFPIAGMQFYGTAGAGGFHETLGTRSDNNVGINVGGGIKMSLAGPLRLRIDYRVFTLHGSPLYSNPQRFYVGLNLKF
jgi:opacity protein-like surface antigen